MSIKRSNSQLYIQNRHNNAIPQRSSGRLTFKGEKSNTQIRVSNGNLLKKSQKLIQSSREKRQIAPSKLRLIRQIFTTISNSQSSKD